MRNSFLNIIICLVGIFCLNIISPDSNKLENEKDKYKYMILLYTVEGKKPKNIPIMLIGDMGNTRRFYTDMDGYIEIYSYNSKVNYIFVGPRRYKGIWKPNTLIEFCVDCFPAEEK